MYLLTELGTSINSRGLCFRSHHNGLSSPLRISLTESKQMELKIALVACTFPKDSPDLMTVLHTAQSQGANLALLPECPAQPWVAATSKASAHDAEPAGGPRESRQSAAARAAEIALLGGSIEQTEDGGRINTAVFWDHHGHEQLRYSNCLLYTSPSPRDFG